MCYCGFPHFHSGRAAPSAPQTLTMSVRHVAARLAGSCSTCENVRTAWKAEQYGSESSQGPHWVPYTDLALAAQGDCQICHFIFGAISLYQSRFHHIDPEILMVHLPHQFDRGLLQLCNGEQTPGDRSHLPPEAILAPRDSDPSQPILELKLFARSMFSSFRRPQSPFMLRHLQKTAGSIWNWKYIIKLSRVRSHKHV